MFISGQVLDWNYHSENSSGPSLDEENETVWRAHEIWRHANFLISPESSEFVLSDVIANLKRAVNHRLQALSRSYSLDTLPFSSQKRVLERFQFYGIIRPAMLKELFAVRNAIEHRDVSPPNYEECNRYVDFVWYFLKSTDSILLMKVEDVIFSSPIRGHNELRFVPKFEGSWRIFVHGELSEEYMLSSAQPGALHLEESAQRPPYIRSQICGRWNPTEEQLINFARSYFALAGYWYEDHA